MNIKNKLCSGRLLLVDEGENGFLLEVDYSSFHIGPYLNSDDIKFKLDNK